MLYIFILDYVFQILVQEILNSSKIDFLNLINKFN
jgi:hypothetical protein